MLYLPRDKGSNLDLVVQSHAPCQLDDPELVGMEGFEPPALWSQTRCSSKLSYIPSMETAPLDASGSYWLSRQYRRKRVNSGAGVGSGRCCGCCRAAVMGEPYPDPSRGVKGFLRATPCG